MGGTNISVTGFTSHSLVTSTHVKTVHVNTWMHESLRFNRYNGLSNVYYISTVSNFTLGERICVCTRVQGFVYCIHLHIELVYVNDVLEDQKRNC